MAEWLVEAGIGETRLALVDDGEIIEARIHPDSDLVAGTILEGRLVARMPQRGQGIVAWDDGEALVSPLPAGVTEGARTRIEIIRPAIPEPGKPKRALARPAAPDAPLGTAEVTTTLGTPARVVRPGTTDLFEAAGWSELLEEAATRHVAFPDGALSIAPTAAMTLIDVDGSLAPAALAQVGAAAAARAIRRLDIGGSIGIDLPGAGGDKAARHAAAAAIDAALPQPFERTAVNGFGFVQIVRRRARRSLVEIYAGEPVLAHARALLRRAERVTGTGAREIIAAPAVITAIEARSAWLETLRQRTGTAIDLRADPALAISAGHVQARFA